MECNKGKVYNNIDISKKIYNLNNHIKRRMPRSYNKVDI